MPIRSFQTGLFCRLARLTEQNNKLNQLSDFHHHCGQIPQDLIIPNSEDPQSHLTQNLLPPGIFVLLQVMDISIDFNDQRRLVTVKIDDESHNDLPLALSTICCSKSATVHPKMDF